MKRLASSARTTICRPHRRECPTRNCAHAGEHWETRVWRLGPSHRPVKAIRRGKQVVVVIDGVERRDRWQQRAELWSCRADPGEVKTVCVCEDFSGQIDAKSARGTAYCAVVSDVVECPCKASRVHSDTVGPRGRLVTTICCLGAHFAHQLTLPEDTYNAPSKTFHAQDRVCHSFDLSHRSCHTFCG